MHKSLTTLLQPMYNQPPIFLDTVFCDHGGKIGTVCAAVDRGGLVMGLMGPLHTMSVRNMVAQLCPHVRVPPSTIYTGYLKKMHTWVRHNGR